jgi:hypothetical protein
MSESRWGKRFEQRLKAKYGIENYDLKGYIYDIAPFGLFLSGDHFYLPNTKLKIIFELDNGSRVELVGKVCRAKKPQQPDWFERDAGMGIKILRFIEGELYYQNYLQQLCSS